MYHQLFEPPVTGSQASVMLLAVVAVIRRLAGVFGAVPPVETVVVVVVVVPPFGRAAATGAMSTATRTGTLHATTQRRINIGSCPTA